MQGRLPHDVPESGERYNIVLEKAGMTRGKVAMAHWIIDSGRYKGCRVSSRLMRPDGSHLEKEDVIAFHKKHKLSYRCSAVLTVSRQAKVGTIWQDVDADYNESDVIVTYELSDYGEPTAPSQLAAVLKRNSVKFRR